MLSIEDFNKLTIGSIVKKPGYNIPWYRVTEIRSPSAESAGTWAARRRSVMLTNFERSPRDIARGPFDVTLWEANSIYDQPVISQFTVPVCDHCHNTAVACVDAWDYADGKHPVCAQCALLAAGNIELTNVAFDGTITVRHGSKTFEITSEGRLVY